MYMYIPGGWSGLMIHVNPTKQPKIARTMQRVRSPVNCESQFRMQGSINFCNEWALSGSSDHALHRHVTVTCIATGVQIGVVMHMLCSICVPINELGMLNAGPYIHVCAMYTSTYRPRGRVLRISSLIGSVPRF